MRNYLLSTLIHIIVLSIIFFLCDSLFQKPETHAPISVEIYTLQSKGGGSSGAKPSSTNESNTNETKKSTTQSTTNTSIAKESIQKEYTPNTNSDILIKKEEITNTSPSNNIQESAESTTDSNNTSGNSDTGTTNIPSSGEGGEGSGSSGNGGNGTGNGDYGTGTNGTGEGTGNAESGSGNSDVGEDALVAKTPPRLLSRQTPNYPENLRVRNIQGRVGISILVSADGSVESVSITSSSGYAEMDDAAISAAYGYSFSPALNAYGNPVRCSVNTSVSFVLNY
jgi:TonB family protein